MSAFNEGDRVKVYNEHGLEGIVTLKGECQISDPYDGEYWDCVFDGDEYQQVSRWVKAENTVSRLYKATS